MHSQRRKKNQIKNMKPQRQNQATTLKQYQLIVHLFISFFRSVSLLLEQKGKDELKSNSLTHATRKCCNNGMPIEGMLEKYILQTNEKEKKKCFSIECNQICAGENDSSGDRRK